MHTFCKLRPLPTIANNRMYPVAKATPVPSATTHGKLLLVVGAAIIKPPTEVGGRSKVLLAQRPKGKANEGMWELPGGKVDDGETPEGACVRELREELGVQVELTALRPLSFVSYPYPTFHLLMPLYAVLSWSGEPRGAEGQEVAFVNADETNQYKLNPADVPLVPEVIRVLREVEEKSS